MVKDLKVKAETDFPDRGRYEVQSEKKIPELNRKPDASVIDLQTGKTVKVYEAARFEKDGSLVRPDEVAKIASNLTKVPPERFGWLFTKQDTFRNPNLIPNVEALQRNVDVTHDLGFVKKKIDIKNYVDLSLVQEAAKRLK